MLSGLPLDRILQLEPVGSGDLAQSHRFVTLFYSDFDPRTRLLRYANAAHNPPLLWRAERRSIHRLDAAGLLIGLQPEADYSSGEVRLEPGDVLLYYTDGVTEAPGITVIASTSEADSGFGECLSQRRRVPGHSRHVV